MGRKESTINKNLFQHQRSERLQRWQVQPDHQDQDVEIVGGKYLISGNSLKAFWKAGKSTSPNLKHLPWQTLTLSHNHRDEEFQVKEEAGFFAEMTTLING